MTTRRSARQTRRVAAACLVLLVTALGILATTMLAPSPAGARPAAHGAHAAYATPAAYAESPPDEPSAGRALPEPDLPHTTTGSDGFVVLGAALAATTLVALVMALRNRSVLRERRRPTGWARATGRAAGPLTSQRISSRSRYSSRSRR